MNQLLGLLDQLDSLTMFVAGTLIAGTFAPLMVVKLCLRRTHPGYDRWTIAELSFALRLVLQLLLKQLPVAAIIVTGNLLLCVFMTMTVEGIYLFTGNRQRRMVPYGISATFLVATYFFYFGVDNAPLRTELFCAYQAVMTAYAVLPLYGTPPKGQRFSYRCTIAVLHTYLVANLLRLATLLFSAQPHANASPGPLDKTYYLVTLLYVIGLTFSFSLLVSERTEAELRAEVKKRRTAERQLKKLTLTDELTQALNRRGLLDALRREAQRADRLQHSFAVLVLDLDNFKSINDEYGHSTGDQALIHMTLVCQRNLRIIDIFGRVGGDEFAVLLPEVGAREAQLVGEKLRSAIEQSPVLNNHDRIVISISIGAVCWQPSDPDGRKTLGRADLALLEAKAAGKNRVFLAAAEQPRIELAGDAGKAENFTCAASKYEK